MGFSARALLRSSSTILKKFQRSASSSSSSSSWVSQRILAPKCNLGNSFSAPIVYPCNNIWISRFCTQHIKEIAMEETPSILNAASGHTDYTNELSEEESGPQRLNYIKMLTLEEVEKVLTDVRAEDVKIIYVHDQCEWADYMVFATGKSTWHIRNMAQALIYKVKQKQKGADQLVLPGVEGREGGKWVVIDSGSIIVHALDENARAYYDLESLWTKERLPKGPNQELENSLKKIRRKRNNSKKARVDSPRV